MSNNRTGIQLTLAEAREEFALKRKTFTRSTPEEIQEIVDSILPTDELIFKYWKQFTSYKQSRSDNWKDVVDKICKCFLKQIKDKTFKFIYKITDGTLQKPYTKERAPSDCIYLWIYDGYLLKLGKTTAKAFTNRMYFHLHNSEERLFLTFSNNVCAQNHSNISNVLLRMHNAGIIKNKPTLNWIEKNLKRIDLFIYPNDKSNTRVLTDIENYFHLSLMPFHEGAFHYDSKKYFECAPAAIKIKAFDKHLTCNRYSIKFVDIK